MPEKHSTTDPGGLNVRTEAGTVILEVVGDVDVERARRIIEVAELAAETGRAVAIDLDEMGSLNEEAAAALLFATGVGRKQASGITLRTSGRPGRQAVLRAYARRRARRLSVA